MNANNRVAFHDDSQTEARLRTVTALCVESLMMRGLDARTIRRTVLGIASRAIGSLASDDYEEETHTAIVQRTVEDMLARSGGLLTADPGASVH